MSYETFNQLRQQHVAIIVSVFAALGGFLYGYDTGTISGLLDMPCFLQTYGHLEENSTTTYVLASGDKSLIVSILSAGTFVGALLGYPSSDYLGRRWGLILAYVIFSIGVAWQTAATGIQLFIVGRFVAGLGVGIVSCIVPLYQSECAPKSIRGAMVSTYQWSITIGLLMAAVVNNATKGLASYSCYRIPVGVQLIWAVVLLVGMLALPESPRYLVLKGRIQEAYRAQSRLSARQPDDPEVIRDVKEFIADTELMRTYGSGTYADCFTTGPQKHLWRTLAGIFLQAWQQLTGINFIFYYGTSFFHSSRIARPFLITILTNAVNVVMTIPGILLIDRLGRRKILIIGAVGMFVCEYAIAVVGVVAGQSSEAAQKTLIVFVCVYIAFFASTWGPATWVVTGELYPAPIRAKCMSLTSAANWLFNFALGYATPYMLDKDKANRGSNVFFVWGSTCFGCLLFAIFCIWETKGLSLEQVNYLVRNSSPLKSTKLNRGLRTGQIMGSERSNGEATQLLNKSLISLPMEPADISADRKNSTENMAGSSTPTHGGDEH